MNSSPKSKPSLSND